MDERVMRRWFLHESGRLNGMRAAKRRSIAELLEEETPSYVTQEGETITIDRPALRAFAEKVGTEGRYKEKVPFEMFIDASLSEEAYITSERVALALRELEGFGEAFRYRDGRMHLPLPIAHEVVIKYPGMFQISYQM